MDDGLNDTVGEWVASISPIAAAIEVRQGRAAMLDEPSVDVPGLA